MSEDRQRLFDLGFRGAGQWSLVVGRPAFRVVEGASARKILYAFIATSTVKYIGESVQSLEQRMAGYANPGPTQRTNIRVQARISELLNAGHSLDVLVFVPATRSG